VAICARASALATLANGQDLMENEEIDADGLNHGRRVRSRAPERPRGPRDCDPRSPQARGATIMVRIANGSGL
jgi:hypothetical protein